MWSLRTLRTAFPLVGTEASPRTDLPHSSEGQPHQFGSRAGIKEGEQNGNAEKCNLMFRLWLTTCSSPAFPISILQVEFQIIIKPPKGLKTVLNYDSLENWEFMEASSSKKAVEAVEQYINMSVTAGLLENDDPDVNARAGVYEVRVNDKNVKKKKTCGGSSTSFSGANGFSAERWVAVKTQYKGFLLKIHHCVPVDSLTTLNLSTALSQSTSHFPFSLW